MEALDNCMVGLVILKQLLVGFLQVAYLLVSSLVLNLSNSLHHPHYTPQTEHHQQATNFKCTLSCD